MDKDKIVAIMNNLHNGSFISAKYTKDESDEISATAKAMGVKTVTKITEVTVRKGIDYDKQKSVLEKVANGKVLTHKLPWGVWSDKADEKDLIIYHKGSSYVRLYFCSVPKSTYFVDGKETAYKDLASIMRPSYFNKPMRDAYAIKCENVISLA